jgi:hypothetical protein
MGMIQTALTHGPAQVPAQQVTPQDSHEN